ncbi:YjbE family putative metal transport protein [Defluviicoccus vanus]|uniref:YjbE family putative metal transport protein n=1 Tax=Defluviicoccus vanus TaxID=111831 RepID=A0A7H1N401_9PROT|nr:YjbE family putative metal transport protein [Defluviicoccus vanus]QNT70437.1 YjbE family putative metal transport protein [Defluviicoccus vanus]
MSDIHTLLQLDALTALVSVVLIDVALAGDNAIAVGMAAAGLPVAQRRRAIVVGVMAAAVLRILFAIFTVHLLEIIGLLLAGGILLLWVAWKLWRELRAAAAEQEAEAALDGDAVSPLAPTKTLAAAVTQIVAADVSMSLDNVLAVAGAAREHEIVLVFGLVLSVALMGLAASVIAHLLKRYHWIAYIGLAIIVYVALRMIWDGTLAVVSAMQF